MTNPVTKLAVGLAVLYAARRYYRNWGTTKEECRSTLLGDRLVRPPSTQSTEGVVVDAPPASVWAALMDELSVRETPAAGDVVRMRPMHGLDLPALTVGQVVAGEAIVLCGGPPEFPWSAVWSFHVVPHWQNQCRLLLRMRAALRRPGDALLTELAGPLTALTMGAMLRRIKVQAESAVDPHHASGKGTMTVTQVT